jgi:hypothetical protein
MYKKFKDYCNGWNQVVFSLINITFVVMLIVVNLQLTIDRNEDFLDATLAQLRDMDRVRSDDYSSF